MFLLQSHLSKTLKGISCGHRVGCLHGVSARGEHLPPVSSSLCLGAQRSELLSTLWRGGQQGERGHYCQGRYDVYCASHPRLLHTQHLRGQSRHHHWRVCASCLIYVPRYDILDQHACRIFVLFCLFLQLLDFNCFVGH